MKHYIYTTLIFFCIQLTTAQTELFRRQFNEYEAFGLSNAEVNALKAEGDLSVFNIEKHSTRLAKELFDKKVGKSVKQKSRSGKTEYEVVAEAEVLHYRVNYIFFDGTKKSYKTIEKGRKKMMRMLDKDYNFESLARQYSMDNNKYKGGDSGWFKIESVNEDFKNAINSSMRYADEVFRVDLPEQNWYYLVKKSYTPMTIREILVLKRED